MQATLKNYDRQHIMRMLQSEREVNSLFAQFVDSISKDMRKWRENGGGSVWVRNQVVEKSIDRKLIELASVLEGAIKKRQVEAWTSANLKNDEIARAFTKGKSLSSVVKEGLFSRNLDALKALQERVDNGMNLSQRVWGIAEQTKKNAEMFLESGIATGRSAEAIGRDMRQMLKDPNKRFRRVRNDEGKLVLSKPMEKYNPGAGVYRSSRMNAVRVAATETNMGYRVSDSERWKKMDFVLGFKVSRSRNGHPCAICDSMVGDYPKDFVFSGWHPFCICFATPIVMDHDDFADFLLDDEIPEDKVIKDIPAGTRKYFDENPKYKESSYAGKNNKEWFGKEFDAAFESEDSGKTLPVKIKDLKGVDAVMQEYTQKHDPGLGKRFKGIHSAPRGSEYYMSANIESGKILVNFAEKNNFNAGDSIVSAIDKIGSGKKLTAHDEYAVEVLWHEILHLKSKNRAALPSIASPDGFPRLVAETINQMVARNTYPEFLQEIGGKASHQKWVLANGYGYKDTVANMRKLLKKAGIDESDFVKRANVRLMEDYTGFDRKMSDLIVEMSGVEDLRRQDEIKHLFKMIEHREFDDFLKIFD